MKFFWKPTLYRFKKGTTLGDLPLTSKLTYARLRRNLYVLVQRLWWNIWVSNYYRAHNYYDSEMEQIDG